MVIVNVKYKTLLSPDNEIFFFIKYKFWFLCTQFKLICWDWDIKIICYIQFTMRFLKLIVESITNTSYFFNPIFKHFISIHYIILIRRHPKNTHLMTVGWIRLSQAYARQPYIFKRQTNLIMVALTLGETGQGHARKSWTNPLTVPTWWWWPWPWEGICQGHARQSWTYPQTVPTWWWWTWPWEGTCHGYASPP